ncbi:hypothetical protein JD844_006124 [Phrynosoma platyrhinos]|uniref:Ig-like domain-containing protein n=1 Tax=Phrynosoma platyrhinos TaxID=52577 RepID=A0ABQ7TPQ0_PHRPL|nr:hypothetical protein JD844_006124 [Phrynosoma platyrhinos]
MHIFMPLSCTIDGSRCNALSFPPIEVLSKPTLSVFPSPFPREAIDPLQLTCGTTATNANINWFFNGSLVENSSRTQLSDDNRILAIRPVLRGDVGNYQCQVSNLVYNETSDALYIPVICEYLVVTPTSSSGPVQSDGPDAAVITPNASTYYEHSDIRLTCAADAFPELEYTWLFNGLKIGSGEKFISPDVRKAQSGNYTCQATNILSRKMASTNLEIQVVGE